MATARGHYVKSGRGYQYSDVFFVSLEEARKMLMEKYEPLAVKFEKKMKKQKKL